MVMVMVMGLEEWGRTRPDQPASQSRLRSHDIHYLPPTPAALPCITSASKAILGRNSGIIIIITTLPLPSKGYHCSHCCIHFIFIFSLSLSERRKRFVCLCLLLKTAITPALVQSEFLTSFIPSSLWGVLFLFFFFFFRGLFSLRDIPVSSSGSGFRFLVSFIRVCMCSFQSRAVKVDTNSNHTIPYHTIPYHNVPYRT
ncbi:hypothetical protein B0T09DRAFT_102306 [Sordaria sp. MPI-SDFR-AT-0083]|nr:hypothetical protein B0T09DRAFT_102306 [Sordaria sp. MPI-SDFR-AT-0083]